MTDTDGLYNACEAFVAWLERRLVVAGRGDEMDVLDVDPDGLFWLGRLAPEDAVVSLGLGERGERLDPCAVGLRIKPGASAPSSFEVRMQARCWRKADSQWTKSDPVVVDVPVLVPARFGTFDFGASEVSSALTATGSVPRRAVIRVDHEPSPSGPELTVTLVNTTDVSNGRGVDLNLYETAIEVRNLVIDPFLLESLPDSFRYDRRVAAYGLNCGVATTDDGIRTEDCPVVDQRRPAYWALDSDPPDLTFDSLSQDPIPSLQALVDAFAEWGETVWSEVELDERARQHGWTREMREQASSAAADFSDELRRVRDGLESLRTDPVVLRSFKLMNAAMGHAAKQKYDSWRPFQVGFLLANIAAIVDAETDSDVADIVWFATGGGKTETYLGLVVMAALRDRMLGKPEGVTAWSRFPLRMLSLQQTQRFADAIAGAELARRSAGIEGEIFSIGFFVGAGSTPNAIPEEVKQDWEPDPDDDAMPDRYQILLRCPFCHGDSVEMGFDRRFWRLEHRCMNDACPWDARGLPFYIVDEEIYRFLPTVVVGTLDKAALISMNAAMRGFVADPYGKCSEAGHGFVYAPRSKHPSGCLVPGCRGSREALTTTHGVLAPSFRLQDELHLLRDSLGAVDAHYEALLDDLQRVLSGRRPKILASSATLAGYEKQVDVLYRRTGRVFPAQGPTATSGFWTTATDRLARRFIAVAPRGQTIEFAVDRMLTELQVQVRRLADPADASVVCDEARIDVAYADALLDIYGVDVIYGNNLRDLDAAARSLETQVPVSPLNTASLTGRTDFEEVRQTLGRLEQPEAAFEERVHVITASSMMSHGVDIDRLNSMVILGVPLTTAEFIQTSARVGRRWPGIVFLLHKIARERDAGVYRSFQHFVQHGDRFVEPVPVTRRSRRVLERTLAGIEMARVLMVHEPAAERALTTIGPLREYFRRTGIVEESEAAAVVESLGLADDLDEGMRIDVDRWMDAFFANLQNPGGSLRFPSELCPWGPPMRSLRDVEEQAPVRD